MWKPLLAAAVAVAAIAWVGGRVHPSIHRDPPPAEDSPGMRQLREGERLVEAWLRDEQAGRSAAAASHWKWPTEYRPALRTVTGWEFFSFARAEAGPVLTVKVRVHSSDPQGHPIVTAYRISIADDTGDPGSPRLQFSWRL